MNPAPKVLIAYTTWTGATRGVAEAVEEILSVQGLDVDLQCAGEVREIRPYQAVVLGTGVHKGQLPHQTLDFVRRHCPILAGLPVAYFLVCLTMAEDTPEHRQIAMDYLSPLFNAAPEVKPVDIALFGGAVLDNTAEYRQLSPLQKISVRSMAKHATDHRDWRAIRSWAIGLPAKLHVTRVFT